MTTNEMIEVMQAYENGAGIQERPNWDQEEEAWKDVRAPKWNWENTEYRISPAKPALTAEDVLMQMKAIEAKYDKIVEPYKEYERTMIKSNSVVLRTILRAVKEAEFTIQCDMDEELLHFIKRYPKLALEAGVLYVKEL